MIKIAFVTLILTTQALACNPYQDNPYASPECKEERNREIQSDNEKRLRELEQKQQSLRMEIEVQRQIDLERRIKGLPLRTW
jgi:hypothetical protein